MPNPTPASARRIPSWRLVLLTALVLLAHWVVLRAAPLALAAHTGTGTSWAFETRTIAAVNPVGPAIDTPKRVSANPAPQRPGKPMPAAPPPASPPEVDANRATALDRNEVVAIESVPASLSDDLSNTHAPTQLAAVTPPDTAVPAAPGASPLADTKPPVAKAIRKYTFPPSARLKYDIKGEIKGFPYHVNGELLWVQDGKSYDARMEISHFLLGSRVQTSSGLLTTHGLEPTRFGDKVRSEVAAHFDREKNKITFSANTPDVPLLPGAQDQLSVLTQLASMLGAEPSRFPKATTLPFQAVGPRSAESWVFTVGDSENLALPGGELNAVHLWRDPIGEFDPRVEIWLAPAVGYLPVRIRLTQANGDVVDQQWRATQKP
jgi:hypothetical protein